MLAVSLIVPTYNSESTIIANLQRANDFLAQRFESHEIIVVDDGSLDQTAVRIKQLNSPQIKAIILDKNSGKGCAIKKAMMIAQGQVRIYTDSDLPYDLRAILLAYEFIATRKFHIVVGDRTLPGSTYYADLGKLRYAATKIFKSLVRLLVTGEQFDTQCGFKAFRADIADAIFPLLTIDRFAFDAELLYIALKYNLELRRIPVRYSKSNKSSVRPFLDGIAMLGQILAIPFKARRGLYRSKYLNELHLMNYWDE